LREWSGSGSLTGMEEAIAEMAKVSDLLKVRRARKMTPRERFLAGAELFEEACLWSLAGIARRHPEMTEAERTEELKRMLRKANS